MNNEKWIYIVVLRNTDAIEVEDDRVVSAWRNETDAEDKAFELNEEETREEIYYEVETVLLQGWEVHGVD